MFAVIRSKRYFTYSATGDTQSQSFLTINLFQQSQQFGYSVSYGGNISTLCSEGVWRNYSKSYHLNGNGALVNSSEGRDKFWTEIVAGMSVNFNANLSFRGEYRFREDYLNKEQISKFKRNLPANPLIYDPISIGKHTLFTSLEWKDLYDRYIVQVRTFLDPVSGQIIVSPLFIWKYHDLQVEISAMVYNNAIPLLNYQGTVLLSYSF